MKCSECGLEDDRDIIAVKNTRWMQSFRSPRKPSHEKRREGMKVNARPKRKISIVGASLIKKFIYSAQNKIL